MCRHRRLPPRRRGATRRATRATVRHGTGLTVRRPSDRTPVGSHRSAKLQRGRCRVREVTHKTSSVRSGSRGEVDSANHAVRSRSRPSRRFIRPPSGFGRPALVGGDGRAELGEGSVQARLGGSHRDVEGLRDRRGRQAEVVVEHQHRPQLRLEAAEATLELVAVGHVAELVGHRVRQDRRQLDLHRPAPPPAHGVEAGVDGEPVEPGIEALGVTQPGQVAPCPDVRVLDRVPRQLRVPDDEVGDGLQPRDGRDDEWREGVMVAPARSFDEVPLVHSHPRWCDPSAACKGNGVARPATCSWGASHRAVLRAQRRHLRPDGRADRRPGRAAACSSARPRGRAPPQPGRSDPRRRAPVRRVDRAARSAAVSARSRSSRCCASRRRPAPRRRDRVGHVAVRRHRPGHGERACGRTRSSAASSAIG